MHRQRNIQKNLELINHPSFMHSISTNVKLRYIIFPIHSQPLNLSISLPNYLPQSSLHLFSTFRHASLISDAQISPLREKQHLELQRFHDILHFLILLQEALCEPTRILIIFREATLKQRLHFCRDSILNALHLLANRPHGTFNDISHLRIHQLILIMVNYPIQLIICILYDTSTPTSPL